jgi:hypothetical protein
VKASVCIHMTEWDLPVFCLSITSILLTFARACGTSINEKRLLCSTA